MRFLVDFGAGQREEDQSSKREVPLWKVPFFLLWKVILIGWGVIKTILRVVYYLLMTTFTLLCILLLAALVI